MTVTEEKNTPALIMDGKSSGKPGPDSASPEQTNPGSKAEPHPGATASQIKEEPLKNSSSGNPNSGNRSSSGNKGVWLVLLLLIAALLYGAWYLARQTMQQQESIANLQTQLQQQQSTQHMQQQTLSAEVDQQLAQQEESVLSMVNDLAQRLDNTAARVLAMSSLNRDDWKLAEAEYLLRLANQRVLLERNSGNAVALAQTVDDILRDLNDPDLFPVRKALANEISELALAGDIDREGVYLRLLALAEQIEKLPLIEPLGAYEEIWPEDEPEVGEGAWAKIKNGMIRIVNTFGNHIRVRDHAQPVPAILPPDNQIYLKQNMRLAFEQAQAALLREEAQVYQASLEKAQAWLKAYFPLNNQSIAAQAEIAELQSVLITQSLPNFSESTALLKTYMERRHKLSVSRRGGQ